MIVDPDVQRRTDAFIEKHRLEIVERLGFGQDGVVWKTSEKSAVKVFERENNYDKERECYRRFRDENVTEIKGFAVPELIRSDPQLMVVEMSIVRPPYVLDFGKVYLDQLSPDYPQTALDDHDARYLDLWGADRWVDVQLLVLELKNRFGIHYQDPKPGNIAFRED